MWIEILKLNNIKFLPDIIEIFYNLFFGFIIIFYIIYIYFIL